MLYYLLICRSLTYAQRTAVVLERAGITARILRSPRGLVEEGCSHAVKIPERSLSLALSVLARADLSPKRIFVMDADGTYREVDQ